MRKSVMRCVGASLAAVAVLTGATGCGEGSGRAGGADEGSKAGAGNRGSGAGARTPEQAITAAYKKTSAAKSAKVVMAVSAPAATGVSVKAKSSGVMGWNPSVADMVMERESTEGPSGGGRERRTIRVSNVMYTKMEGAAKATGKGWVKFDVLAAVKDSDDARFLKQTTAELEGMSDDPTRKLALLLYAPTIEDAGPEDIGGGRTEHYKGSFAAESVLSSPKKVAALTPERREQLLTNLKTKDIQEYAFDVWVNSADYPVRINTWMKSRQGVTTTSADFSDYGTRLAVQAPPADDTVDVAELAVAARKQELD
ncbi:hypothetical protein ACFU99_42215, partial [Streptomyces sp. NPDC057654]|uniref:hypothetical protein n=1 Tax=Streptomyces sp. NPDC057654 TaxID=3346196 RepID=UPI00368CE22E